MAKWDGWDEWDGFQRGRTGEGGGSAMSDMRWGSGCAALWRAERVLKESGGRLCRSDGASEGVSGGGGGL